MARSLSQDREDPEIESIVGQYVGERHAEEGRDDRHEMASGFRDHMDQAFRDRLDHPCAGHDPDEDASGENQQGYRHDVVGVFSDDFLLVFDTREVHQDAQAEGEHEQDRERHEAEHHHGDQRDGEYSVEEEAPVGQFELGEVAHDLVMIKLHNTQTTALPATKIEGRENHPARSSDHERQHLDEQLCDVYVHGTCRTRKGPGPREDVHHPVGQQQNGGQNLQAHPCTSV
ncbi:hypothetical protein D9M71_585200 [compost metagenome]